MFRLSKVWWTWFCLLALFASTAVAQPAPEVIASTPSADPTANTVEAEAEPALIREPPQPTKEERLGEWFDSLARAQRSSRRFDGFFNILNGSLFTALGGLWFADTSYGEDPSQLQKGFGLVALVVGGTMVGRGIYQLAVPTTIEKASEQYEGARSRGLSDKELGRSEGILATFSDQVHREKRRQRWRGLGWLIGGGLVLALTPVADLSADNGDRGVAYATGAVTASIGAFAFGLSFAGKGPSAWDLYREGQAPEVSKPTARVTPSVGRSYAGLSLSGTF